MPILSGESISRHFGAQCGARRAWLCLDFGLSLSFRSVAVEFFGMPGKGTSRFPSQF